ESQSRCRRSWSWLVVQADDGIRDCHVTGVQTCALPIFASSSAPTSSRGARWSAYCLPLTVTRPAVGRSSPRIIRIVVDFPAPFGPRKPVTRPGRTVNDTESTASFSPYLLVRSTASIIGFLSVL